MQNERKANNIKVEAGPSVIKRRKTMKLDEALEARFTDNMCSLY
jgi:hypothetical protein